jgi:N-acetylneuraminic acid mutarotase
MRRFLMLALASCGGDPAPATPDGPGDGPQPGECDDTAPWAAAAPLAIGATQETAVVAVDGKIYILGGFNNLTITDAVQIFDTATCTYAAGPPLPKAVHHVNAAVVDGAIIVGGALEGGNFTAIGDTWSWNPATDADWAIRASLPLGSQRGASVAGAIDGKLYIAGGFRAGTAVVDVDVYDPVLDTWTPEMALPAARDHGCGGVIDGKLYVAGGRMASIPSTTTTTFELAPGTPWATKAAMPTARGGTACGVIDDRLIVVGGEGNPNAGNGVFPQVEAYSATDDEWETLTPMPTPRHGMGAAASGGRLYVPGGADSQGFGAVATHEVFTP